MYIEVRDAVKKYGEGEETTVFALDHVNLEIEEGEICVILGPSGSGKSTLLNMLGGIDSLTGGKIIIKGEDISSMNKKQLTEFRRERVGFVFQSYNLIPDLTVKENVEVVRDISKEPLDVDRLLEDLDIKKHMHKFPRELSGGQQQRTAIARALVKNPALLLCDELTGALDSKSSRYVLKMLELVNQKYRTTIIIITHNEGIAGMADRIIRIHDGKVVENSLNKDKLKTEELEI